MDKPNNKDKVLNPTVVKLGLVSFFADIASEMLYPITPIFLTTILHASMFHLGIIEGAAEATASLLKVYSGTWSDRFLKRKPFVFAGYFLAAISKPFIGLSHTWLGVFGARTLDRIGKGIRTAPRDAMIADSVGAIHRGAAFGWHRGMDTMGAALGPLFALFFLSQDGQNLRSLFFWALIPGLLSVVIIFFVKEQQQESNSKKIENPFKLWNQFDPSFKNYIYAWSAFSLVNSSDVFLLLKAKNSGLSTQAIILVYCAYNLVYSLSSPWLGKLSDQIGRKKLMTLGLLTFALVYLGFGFAKESWHFWFLFLIYGLYMGATDSVGKALVIDLSPSNLKATSIGILGTTTGLCTILASSAGGFIWDYFGSSWTFFYGAFGALIALAIFQKITN